MTVTTLSAVDARAAVMAGALLVDIRSEDEHARQRIPGALNLPLPRLGDLAGSELRRAGQPVVFHCQGGMRTAANADALARAAYPAPAYILDGGINAWQGAGQPVVADRSQPLEIMRQVQITAGALVLVGVLLGLFAGQAFFALPAFVGCGLMFAGITGWCGMANLLRHMPWNRRARA